MSVFLTKVEPTRLAPLSLLISKEVVNLKIGIVDADLIGRKKHRFPNLACMKISGYYKELGNDVNLLLDYNNLEDYDKVFISKVFLDTEIVEDILSLPNVEYGGTGFFYDKANPLDDKIEHHMPDYELYDDWVKIQLDNGVRKLHLKYYTDYSIGFTTRGCFRQCEFCVNKNYTKVSKHSPLNEFLDTNRKKICLLDDNILGSADWKNIIEELQLTNKKFEYKQGMDIRLMTDEKAKMLVDSRYDGDYIFAFDNIEDKSIIEDKLKLWKKYNVTKGQNTKLYVFCGFDKEGRWDDDFWINDIVDLFERIAILMKYNCKPYIMRYYKYEDSPHRGIYINVAQWCNQPSLFAKHSYKELCDKDNERKGGNSATKRYNDKFIEEYLDIAKKYFDLSLKSEVVYKGGIL